MTNVLHVYTAFKNSGGAQNVLLDIQESLGGCVLALHSFDKCHPSYRINSRKFIKFGILNLIKNKNSVVFSHHRRMTLILFLLNTILRLKLRIIHVAHNEFHDFRIFGKCVGQAVAVSEKVKDNLVDFFGVPEENVTVIYNGRKDIDSNKICDRSTLQSPIRILYAGRVTSVKRQVEVARHIKRANLKKTVVEFAGDGPELSSLLDVCDSERIRYIGFQPNLEDLYCAYDFVLLFSSKEGLPLTLIESLRSGVPAICNNVGGNWEVINDNCGFRVDDFSSLIELLRSFEESRYVPYKEMSVSARDRFLGQFSLDSMVNEYRRLV